MGSEVFAFVCRFCREPVVLLGLSKVRVVIDTSTLRSDARLSSGPMEALARFAEKGYVEILIPYVVAQEFTTRPSSKIESQSELHVTLKKLKQNVPKDLHVPIAEFQTRIADEFDKLESDAKQRFTEWQTRTGATIVNPGSDHAMKVMAKYFAGVLPFGSVKARADIPDAFIVEAILDLASKGQLFAIAKDDRMLRALQNLPNIKVFTNIKKLLESDQFDEALAEIGVDTETEYETENVEKVVTEFLRDHARFVPALESDVSSLVTGRTLRYRNPQYDEKEGLDELYIDTVNEVSGWSFDGESDYLGEGVILVNFEARAQVSVDDPLPGPYYDEDGHLDFSREVTVSGALSLNLDPVDLRQNSMNSVGEVLLKSATASVDELDDISLVSRGY